MTGWKGQARIVGIKSETVEQVRDPDQDRRVIDGLIAGNDDSVRMVRSWIRLAAGRYRRFLANDLEDLEQDILTSLVVGLANDRFQYASRLETYVSRMVHYKCIDRMRAASRRQWVDVEDLDLVDEDTSALDAIQRQQTSQLALRVAESLGQPCRDLWALIRAGLSYAEMAERTGVAPGTLRVRVSRCRRKAIAERDRIVAIRSQHKGNE